MSRTPEQLDLDRVRHGGRRPGARRKPGPKPRDPDALDALEKAREARVADEARRLAEIAVKREECLNLLREGGFRGDALAWEELARYDTTSGEPEVGIVPPVEHYAWLELEIGRG